MKRLRIVVCLFFVVSCAIFGMYVFKERLVEDNTPPVITCDSNEISVSVEAEDADILKGVKAKDNRDGDITKSVRISSMSHFIKKGTRTVTYLVFDKAYQAGSITRTLTYTDYRSPRIYLKKPLRYASNQTKDVNLLKNMVAEDCLDGDITSQIRTTLSDGYYQMQPGEYELSVQVNNSAGDVCVLPLVVEIKDSTDRDENFRRYPMLSDYVVYTKVNEELDFNEYLTGVIQGNEEYTFEKDGKSMKFGRNDISISSNVDYENPGVYTVEYTYSNDKEPTAVTKLYVVVEE